MVVLHLRGEGARSANTIGIVGLPRRRLRHEADRVVGLEHDVLQREVSLLRVEVVVTIPFRFGRTPSPHPRALARASSSRFLVRLPLAHGPAEAKKRNGRQLSYP